MYEYLKRCWSIKISPSIFRFRLWLSIPKLKRENTKIRLKHSKVQVHVITGKQEKLIELPCKVPICYLHVHLRVPVGLLNLSNMSITSLIRNPFYKYYEMIKYDRVWSSLSLSPLGFFITPRDNRIIFEELFLFIEQPLKGTKNIFISSNP